MIKSVKRLGAAVLSAVMMLTAVATPLGDNLPAVRESTSLTASASDWKRTFINNKSDSRINSAINAISNQANVSKCNQSGKSVSDIIRFMIFDSKYAVYGNNAILDKYTNAKYPTCQGSFPEETVYGNKVSFTKAVGCLWYARYVTTVIYGKEGSKIYINKNSVTAIRDFITKNAQAGEHIRMEGGTYQHSIVYVSSDSNGFYYLDYFGNSGDKPRFTYTTYTDFYNHVKSMSKVYLANANSGSTPSTDNVKLTGTSYKIANTVSDTNAFVVTDVYKPSNYKLTKAGIRIRRYDGSYDNGWSEFHNTASTWTGYDYMRISYDMNSEVKITLRHGTKYYYKFYAVIEGKEYWSPEQSFTTTGSHSYGSWYTKTSATCTSGGTEERKCSCGATESRSTSALGHNYGSWSTVTNATCTSGGSEKRTCSRCSNSETRSTSALGHNFGSTYFEADHPHKYAHLCQRCGYKEFTGGNLDYYYLCATCTHLTKPEITKITGDLVDNSEITIEWTASESDKLANYWLDVFDPDGQNVVDVSTGKINSYTFTPVKIGTYTIKTFAAPIGNKDGSGSVGAETTIEIGCNHNYSTEIVNPTYDNEGYTLHTCTKCGYSYKDNYTPALKLTELTGVKVKTQGTNSLTLAWDKNANAKGYIIEQYKGGKWTQVAKTSSNTAVTYTVNGLAADTTYTFRIKAYVISGESEIYGGYVKIAGKTRIPNVASFKGRAVSQTAVKLDWSKNDKATGYVIEQYKGGKWTVLATTKNNTTLTFTVKGLAKGTAYSFRIKSFRKTGSATEFSEYTAIKAATLLDGVSNFKVASTTGSWITLEWAKNDKATGYSIEQYKGGKWTVIATTKNNATLKFTVKGLKNDTTYSFRIRAYKTAGASNVYSDYVRIAGKTRIPNVATFKGRAVSASAVKLDWSKNDKATGYVIEQYKGGKWTQIAVTKNNTTLTFTVKGLAECTPYSFRVKAYKNDGGKTNYSDYVTVKASTLLGTVKNAKVTSVTGSCITLEWAKNGNATGYSIEQYKGGKWTVIATTKNNTTLKFTVKGLKNDTTYSFRIRAYKTAGGSNVYSDYVRIAGKTRIPNVTTFTGSAVSASAVKLDWSKNDKATGYVIEQYKGGKWTVIATTKNNTTLKFTVKGLAKGTAYSFRIKSFRKTGSTTEFSEYASVKVNTAE